jgi:hypothetical protein
MRLADLARVVRSKNAGPAMLTIDILLADADDQARVLRAGWLTPAAIGALYGVPACEVRIIAFPPARAVKITMPRAPAGGPGDRDTYGAQLHAPLLDLLV